MLIPNDLRWSDPVPPNQAFDLKAASTYEFEIDSFNLGKPGWGEVSANFNAQPEEVTFHGNASMEFDITLQPAGVGADDILTVS